eukprot:gene5330-biopygen13105
MYTDVSTSAYPSRVGASIYTPDERRGNLNTGRHRNVSTVHGAAWRAGCARGRRGSHVAQPLPFPPRCLRLQPKTADEELSELVLTSFVFVNDTTDRAQEIGGIVVHQEHMSPFCDQLCTETLVYTWLRPWPLGLFSRGEYQHPLEMSARSLWQ